MWNKLPHLLILCQNTFLFCVWYLCVLGCTSFPKPRIPMQGVLVFIWTTLFLILCMTIPPFITFPPVLTSYGVTFLFCTFHFHLYVILFLCVYKVCMIQYTTPIHFNVLNPLFFYQKPPLHQPAAPMPPKKTSVAASKSATNTPYVSSCNFCFVSPSHSVPFI